MTFSTTTMPSKFKAAFQIGEKVFEFICDNDVPLEHAKEALFQFLKYVGQIEDQINAAKAASSAQPAAAEPTPEVKNDQPNPQ